MKKNRRCGRRFLAVFLSGVLFCTGCENQIQESVPELMEPKAANAAYRPVELGTIGETEVLYGTVMPTEYCCFFDSYTGIAEIIVEVGDYVEKGDIVAYADVEMAKEQLDNLNAQLQNENQNYELNSKIAKVRIKQMKDGDTSQFTEKTENVEELKSEESLEGGEGLKSEGSLENTEEPKSEESLEGTEESKSEEKSESTEEPKSEESLESIEKSKREESLESTEESKNVEKPEKKEDTESTENDKNTVEASSLAIEQENMRYDEILHKYRVKKLQEAISSQQKIIVEGTLKASHSGRVIYTKNLGESTDAAAYENIVVLVDTQETCIELTDETIDSYAYENYEVKYVQLAGKQYDVTELSYGMDVKVLAKAKGEYPNVRLICPDAGKLTIGKTYPVFYKKKRLEEMPVLGLDSLNGEEGNYFVYVKNEKGEQEKRDVTIGEKDNYYVQIVSGLEIGEEVYYKSNACMPAEYEKYTVELSDYMIKNLSRTYQLADEQTFWYDSECEGNITEIAVTMGDEVEEGDLLYVMESQAGKAALAAAKNDISREKTTYQKNVKQIEKSLKSETDKNQKKILAYQKEIETINHTYRLKQLKKIYSNMARNNDGNGKISIYAKQSGTISDIVAEEGMSVTPGSHILSIGTVAKDKLLVQMQELKDERNYVKNIADFGEEITITIEDRVYQGVCIGMTVHQNNNLGKYYVTATEEEAAISYCTKSGYSCPAFYVEMEDETFYQKMLKLPNGAVAFSYIEMEDVVVVPTAIVQEENNETNPMQVDYYVWRLVGDELVKQYVLVNKEFSDLNMTVILSGVQEKDVLARGK